MKNYFILAALLCVFHSAHAQTPLKTINYQALIVDPAAIELPGNAVQAQLYLNKEVWVKFGIYAGTTLQFEELHKTKTDGYGLINLEIGAGQNTVAAGTFASIKWSNTLMKLVTQVSFNQGAKYTEVSNRGLNYLPYAHFSEEAGRLTGILTVTSGGTGATSAPAARANLGLGNVDNTADVDKPVSGLVLAELTSKESILNKSNSIISDSASSEKYPSVKAVKTYVDNRTTTANVANQANSANLAAKATTLETPRTINGVPFDGSANIAIPIDAAILTGIIPITKGGTGAVTASSARTNLGLKIGVDVQAPLVAGIDYQIPLIAGTDYQRPLIAGTDYQRPLVAGTDYQRPLIAGVDYQIPLIAGTDYQRPLISGTDYQVPLVGGVDYQRPLVAGTDYQTPISAGSGISISSGSVSATGLTTANLSATAGITNGQLASSTFTLGSTTAALGGTYSNVAGLTLASPVLTGIPTAPTAAASDNSQQIATTAFVKAVTANLGGVTTVSSISVNAAGNTFSSTVANPTTTPQLSLTIPLASASGTTAGLLSNSDYANFNAKQSALTSGVDYQRPLVGGVDYQRPLVAGINYQIPLIAGTDYQRPLVAGINYQIPLIAGTDYQRPLVAGIDYQTPLIAGTDFQIPLIAGTNYQTPLVAGVDYQIPLVAGTDYQGPLISGTDYQVPLIAGVDYQTPLIAGTDFQIPLIAGTNYQTPLVAGVDYQIPLVAGTDYQRPLISGTDYQVPLTAGVDYQRPLVAGTDYQTPITAGSGISILSGSVAATGLTTANLSATAGITNGQLANSGFILGSTTAALGGTYTNVDGLTLASPVLTGISTAPTAATSDNSQQIATTAFVKAVTASLGSVTSVPSISVNAAGNTFSSTVANPTTTPQLSLTIPLASASGTTAGLLSNSDYANFNAKQTALTAGVDYQRPLVSGTDYQTPLTAGSGISISSGSVAATGLTTANLSATAGITNGQLANSGFTLGTTTAALGGTYTNVDGLTLASPDLTGIPTAPTAATSENSQQIATTAFVKAVTASLGSVTSVPSISVNAAGNTFSSTVANPTTTPHLSLTIPLASASGTTAGLLSNSDYANFNAKQAALTAGSGIAINSGSIAATGLTTANLSSTASITNGQLANSRITLGSTNATLGGTFTSVTGLSSVASTSFVGALTGNATTATTLQTPRTIFGASFDGSAALAGTISPTYGGTGVNNGSNTLTLGGNLGTSGSFATILTTTAATSITLPVTGTLATLLGTETLSNKTLTSPVFSGTTTVNGALTLSGANVLTAGGTIFPTATGTTGQVLTLSAAGTAAWSTAGTTVREVFDETASNGSTGTLSAATSAQVNFTLSQTPNSLSKLRMFINGILISQNAYSYQTSGSFNSTTATPTRYLTYVNTYNGSYTISAGDRVQFVYFY